MKKSPKIKPTKRTLELNRFFKEMDKINPGPVNPKLDVVKLLRKYSR